MASRRHSWFSAPGVCSLAAMAMGLAGFAGTTNAGTYGSLSTFQAGSRSDLFFQAFGGSPDFNYPPQNVSGNGYAYTVGVTPGTGSLSRTVHGVGPVNSADAGLITFTGRPVSAFAGIFVVEDGLTNAIASSITVSTDTGESFTFSVPAQGLFFGFTTTRPFTTLRYDAAPAAGGRYEVVDNVYVGASDFAPTPSDQCSDAPTVAGASVQVPFDTTNATYENVPGACTTGDTGPDVWVRYVASSSGLVTMTTCGCSYDSTLRVFNACGGLQLACNDDTACGGNNYSSTVTIRARAGSAYLARIGGYLHSGFGVLSITATPDCPGDFNHSGGTDVQDIFDFLTSWFSGCP